jgi:membrane protease YdiL (CAAX protease family)
MLSHAVGIAFAVFLLFGVPVLSVLTARDVRLRTAPRLALYYSAVLSQWILAVLGLLAVVGSGLSLAGVGFRGLAAAPLLRSAAAVTALALGFMVLLLFLERWGWWPDETPLVYLLIPETRREKLWAALVLAPTAAITEEFLYRGFLLLQLTRWFHSAAWAWVLSSAAFGLAHAYQGLSGATRAALLGGLLAYPVWRLGSLYPSMAAHLVLDVLALAWLGPKMLRQQKQP